ncbi:protein kinase [Actinocorallia sp. API 0066]|uniref:serine/threonine-protein kinase n=1 Tax=Actinocorallia sp. API 0066 TaxID=2896846 RepID=UPI001E596558|nr:serine/threonine-protein kinase [Actinocorallia sp. API 0066]MCD0452599.1 protein kinase [Actinocorallia sp. API 0066]
MDRTWTVPGYRHIRELGAGASGRVVMAVHEETSIEVAIKYLSPELAMDPEFVLRFRDEAQLLSELEDPHLVQFFEYVETSTSAAIVMELVDGVSLAHILADAGPTTPEAALTVLKGSLLGLASAHASGIVHRDYKPGNVLVDGQGTSFLSDFGIAVRAGEDIAAAGTPAYMPPEQWNGNPVTAAADVYAATAVAYECLTGRRPYQAATLPALAVAHREQPVPVEDVPEGLRPLIAAGLAKDVQERPQSAFAFLLELEMTAGAAYGPGWEDKGRAHLKTRALALALLFPVSRPSDYAAPSDAATTMLDGPGRVPAVLESAPYRPSKRLGLAAVTAGAVASFTLLSGAVMVLNNSANHQAVQPHAAQATPDSPAAQAGGGPVPSPSATPGSGPRPGPVIVVTADPISDPASPTGTPTPSPSGPTPTETDAPEPEPTDPTATPDPTGTPTDPAEPEPTEPAEPDPTPSSPATPDADDDKPDAPQAPTPTVTTQAAPPVPVAVSGLRVTARASGSTMVVTVGVTGVTGTSGSTAVTLRLLVDGQTSAVIVVPNVTGPTTRVYTRPLANCGTGSATASADGVSVASATVKAPCVR